MVAIVMRNLSFCNDKNKKQTKFSIVWVTRNIPNYIPTKKLITASLNITCTIHYRTKSPT